MYIAALGDSILPFVRPKVGDTFCGGIEQSLNGETYREEASFRLLLPL
jgi:hypothetical protein